MAQPPIYSRAYDFSAYQTSNPQDPLPAAQVEAELDRIKSTLDAVLNNMAILQRDDTQLANQSVTAESLSQDALAIAQADGFNIRGDWATGIYYEINDVVDFNSATYICINAHTSASTFDSLAAHWLLLANAAIDTSASAVDQFLGTGSQAVFTLSYIYSSNTDVLVFVDGQLNTPVDDYSITQNTITFVNPPSTPAVAGRENVIIWGPTVTTANAVANARQAETNAAGSEAAALASQQAAAASAVTASGNENAAGVSAAAALVSEQAALGSENASSASEQAADASEQAALASQNAASVSAAAALVSEQAADASEQASLSSEQTATTQASNAAASAVTAEQHKDDAESAKTSAESARDSALASFDSFDDRYLGAKTSDPSVDNDGNSLVAGALYFNEQSGDMKVFNGTSWVDAYADGATLVAKAGDTMTGNLSFGDNNKAIFGAGSDLQIYHDGSHSYIKDAGSGDLLVRGDNLRLQSASGENYLYALSNGATMLYNNNAQKLATTSTGCAVNGTVTADGGAFTGNVTFGDNNKTIFGAGSDLEIYHDGSNSIIKDNGTGNLELQGSSWTVVKGATSGTWGIAHLDGAQTNLYHNGSLKLATTTTGINVSSSGDSVVRVTSADGNGAFLDLGDVSDPDGGRIVYDSGSNLTFSTASTERARLDASGNLLVGKTNTSSALTTAGVDLRPEGRSFMTRNAGPSLYLSRTTSDGNIAEFYKDNTTVGSIGSYSGTGLTLASGGELRFFTSTSNEDMRLETDGDLHVDGNVVAYSTTISDIRLKKDIAPIEDAVTKVQQLNGCTFTYLKDDRKSAGLIAQDLERVLPSAVIEDKAVFHGEEGETYKTVQYDQVIGLLVEAVKELKAEIEELKNGTAK